jgi:hypothetical protein
MDTQTQMPFSSGLRAGNFTYELPIPGLILALQYRRMNDMYIDPLVQACLDQTFFRGRRRW